MSISIFDELIKRNIRKYVFLGESGSGKSEIAINFASFLSKLTNKNIHFFDMDQTKPLFRSRDIDDVLIRRGIIFHAGKQLLDTPIVPHGIESIINDENNLVIFDVGGNSIGAVNMGQYSAFLNDEETISYIILNYYRPFSENSKDIEQTMNQIMRASRINNVEIVCNPNLGVHTTIEDIIYGYEQTCKLLEETKYKIFTLAIMKDLYNERIKQASERVMKITPYINSIISK